VTKRTPVNKNILIAEDELYIIESLRFILEQEGYSVSEVHDGKHVMNCVRSAPPHVLILDLMLPNKNGFEILKELKSDAAIKNVTVLMLTAKGQQQDRTTARQLGVDAFITKPFSNREVLECVNKLANG
jgi:DNA-binding response OmpR family regulator